MIRPTLDRLRHSLDRQGTPGVYTLLLIQQFLSSGTYIVAKAVTGSMDALTLTLVRSLLSAPLMALMLLLRGRPVRIHREDLGLVLFLSLLAIPFNQFFFLYGMHFTIPSNAALLYATTPILVLLLSRIFLKEPLTRAKLLGVGLGFIGVLIVIFERGLDASMQYVAGNLLVGVAVIAWGFYSVFGKRLIARYGAVHASAVTLILGTVFFLPVGAVPMLSFPFASLSAGEWGEIFYLAIVTSVVSYFLWNFALSRIEAGKAALFANLQPVITTLLAVTLLGQEVTPAFVVGGSIALTGV
ncbi:MAG TPA: EamA family transporter, partial [Bacteroidota bacterium]